VILSAANANDATMLEAVLEDIPPIRMPTGRRRRRPGKLHADEAYDHRRCRAYLRRRGIQPRDRPPQDRVVGAAGPPPVDDRADWGLAGRLQAAADPLRARLPAVLRLGDAGLLGDLLQRPPTVTMVTFQECAVSRRKRRQRARLGSPQQSAPG